MLEGLSAKVQRQCSLLLDLGCKARCRTRPAAQGAVHAAAWVPHALTRLPG